MTDECNEQSETAGPWPQFAEYYRFIREEEDERKKTFVFMCNECKILLHCHESSSANLKRHYRVIHIQDTIFLTSYVIGTAFKK